MLADRRSLRAAGRRRCSRMWRRRGGLRRGVDGACGRYPGQMRYGDLSPIRVPVASGWRHDAGRLSAWLTQHGEVGILRSRPLKRHALLRVGRTERVILGSSARPRRFDTSVALRRVSAAATLLENGTEESQKLVRARSVPSGADHVISSSIKHGQHYIYPSWCQLAEGLRSPDADSLRFPGRSAAPRISMESLILAQDERWRRA